MDEKIEEMYQEFLCYKFKTKAEDFSCKGMCENFYRKGYRKESDAARECLEQFICRLVNDRIVGVNDDLYYELLEAKDDLLKEKYAVE